MMWQPIETAPRDGTYVDLWVETDFGGSRVADCRFGISHWNYTKEAEWIFVDRYETEPHRDVWHDICYVYGENSATHWMPLPEPPK